MIYNAYLLQQEVELHEVSINAIPLDGGGCCKNSEIEDKRESQKLRFERERVKDYIMMLVLRYLAPSTYKIK